MFLLLEKPPICCSNDFNSDILFIIYPIRFFTFLQVIKLIWKNSYQSILCIPYSYLFFILLCKSIIYLTTLFFMPYVLRSVRYDPLPLHLPRDSSLENGVLPKFLLNGEHGLLHFLFLCKLFILLLALRFKGSIVGKRSSCS